MMTSQGTAKITSQLWGEHAGEQVYLFKMENPSGAYVELTNYGATLVSVVVPDAHGTPGHTVLGFKTLQGYLNDTCYLGSTVGRYANRIGGAVFTLDKVSYQLDKNDGENANHGGFHGFHARVFKHAITAEGLFFTLQSSDGEGGYPGNLELTVHYVWTELNELIITYYASTDKKTIANFTNHAYFNLSNQHGAIFDHTLTVYADHLLKSDPAYIPTGIIKPVGDKKFADTLLRDKLITDNGDIQGLNDCFVINHQQGAHHRLAAELTDKASGRKLEVFTTYPSIMVYTADYLQSEQPGHQDRPYKAFEGVCLECQYYPDSPNHSHFPSTVLNPGDTYHESIIYKFSTTVS